MIISRVLLLGSKSADPKGPAVFFGLRIYQVESRSDEGKGIRFRYTHNFVNTKLAISEIDLCRFFCGQRSNWKVLVSRTHNFHLFPVIRHFLTTIQTHHIGSGHSTGRSPSPLLDGDGKAVMAVRTPKQRIQEPGKHTFLPQSRRGLGAGSASTYIRFRISGKGSMVKEGVR